MFLINNLLYLERTKLFHCKKKNIQISTNLCLSIHIVVALARRYDELGHNTLRTPTNSNRAQRSGYLERRTKAYSFREAMHGHTFAIYLCWIYLETMDGDRRHGGRSRAQGMEKNDKCTSNDIVTDASHFHFLAHPQHC